MLHVLLCFATMHLTHAHETTPAGGHDHSHHDNTTHIIATHSISTLSPTNYPNLTNLDLGNVYTADTSSNIDATDTVIVLMLSLGAFALISAFCILTFKLFLTWRDHSEQYVNKKPRAHSIVSILSVSRPSRSREPTVSNGRDPEALRKESVLTEIWNDAETTHELESGYAEHITSKTHDTDAITEAPSARQRVGSTGYIEAIFAQYNQPDEDGVDAMGQMVDEKEAEEDEEKQAVLDINDELYRSPTKKYRIAVSSIDDLEPFDINESFEEIVAGSVTPPHREQAEEHSLETQTHDEGREARGHVRSAMSLESIVSVDSVGDGRSRSRSVESMAGFEAEESVEESSEELVGPTEVEMETQGAGYVD